MSRTIRSLGLATALAALVSPTQAYLHSQSTQGQQLRQEVRINDHVVRTTVHEGWADVEEELSLGTQLSQDTWNPAPTENLNSWEIAGQFTLPEGAVVTGALLWNGNTILKAKLKGTSQASGEYEAVVDRQTAPIATPRDPLLIEKIGANYSLKLYPVQWNGSRRLRLRYLVPLQADGDGWKIPLGSAFAQEAAGHADQYELNLDNQGGSALRLERDGMLMPFTTTTKLIDYPIVQTGSSWWEPAPSFHAPVAVVLPQKGSIALATSVDSGAWSGGYVMFRGKLPDSLLTQSKLRQELLVLWKWNSPASFVENYSGYFIGYTPDLQTTKQVSSYGYQMLDQASMLINSTTALARASSLVRVGLVADEGDNRKPHTFGLSSWGSDSFALMQEYLGQFNTDTLLNRYSPAQAGNNGGSGAKARKEGAKQLASDLQIAFSLYSKDSGVVRHIVFVTAGPASDLPDASISLPNWPTGLTASSYSTYSYWGNGDAAHWPGADLPSLVNQHALPAERQINNWLPFTTPLTRVTWNLEFTAGTRSFSMDAVTGLEEGAGSRTAIEFNGHAKAAWDAKLAWKLYDENGQLVRTTDNAAANWIQLPNDSAVARLWGGSRNHWSETLRTRAVGSIYGFVDAAHSLLALPSDSLESSLQGRYRDQGVPFLLGSEIFGADVATTEPIPGDDPLATGTISKSNIAGFAVRSLLGGRGLSILLPAGLDAQSELIVRDLQGRILARWNGIQLMNLKSLNWNAPSGTARGMLVVELRTGSLRSVQSASVL